MLVRTGVWLNHWAAALAYRLTSVCIVFFVAAAHKKAVSHRKRGLGKKGDNSFLHVRVPRYNVLSHYVLRRRMNDVVVGYFTASIPSAAGSSGSYSSMPLLIGAPGSESFSNLQYVPFASSIRLDGCAAFADIQAFWREYRFLAVECEAQLMTGPSYNSAVAGASQVPEIHLYSDPRDAVTPVVVSDADKFSDIERKMLSVEKCFKWACQPKPAFQMFLSGVASSYASPSANQEIWLETSDAATPHYSFKGFIRQFNTQVELVQIRFSFTAYIALRRPQ